MADEILYSWGPGQSLLARISDGRVTGFLVDRPSLITGAVFLGRVTEVNTRLDAAFVDLGRTRAGFLPGAAALGLTQGAATLVQVRADAQGGKGPLLTAEISAPGRWLAYSPFRPGLAASRRLEACESARLLALAARLTTPAEGVVLRTAAEGIGEAELAAELNRLRADWAEIERRRHAVKAPALVWRPHPLARALADAPRVTRVRVDDSAAFAEARRLFPELVEHHRDGPLFALYDADEALAQALAPVVPLPSGGRLIIEPTAALLAIDVDSGAGAPADANREAVAEIARQLTLRSVGGQVTVDFVKSGGKGALFKLVGALKRAVAADPVPTHVFGVTPLELVELTRERRGPALADLMLERRQHLSAEAAALHALSRVLAEMSHRPGAALGLTVAPEVADALARLPEAVAEAERRLGCPLPIRSQPGRARDDSAVEENAP